MRDFQNVRSFPDRPPAGGEHIARIVPAELMAEIPATQFRKLEEVFQTLKSTAFCDLKPKIISKCNTAPRTWACGASKKFQLVKIVPRILRRRPGRHERCRECGCECRKIPQSHPHRNKRVGLQGMGG